jgi:eukaryotic-like serine/threonine-protein kinase
MTITQPFVLKDDVVLMPCAEMNDTIRARITFDEGDFTLAHRHGRADVRVIDGGTAALLELFRQPRTIADAVLENSRALGKAPHDRLEELLPHLGALIDDRILVPAGSGDERGVRPRYESGDTVAGWTIVRCVNLVEDSEVHQVRRGDAVAALKIARVATPLIESLFDNEEAVLRRLEGSGVAPALLDAGVHDGRRYLVVEWISGVDVWGAAAQRRHDRAALAGLCASIAEAYAAIHARGVLHVDVHPRNALAGEKVALVDFGGASLLGQPQAAGRITMTFFYEPEYAAQPPSEAGEQYAVAALLYLLLAGDHYLDFRYDRDEMLRQIECDPALPFAARGAAPWPEVEEILLRALQKDPSQRHESMAAMAARLAAVRDATARASLATPLSAEANALLESTLRSFAHGGSMFASRYPSPASASINNGCAGAAIGLLRIAETRGDPALLALASVWSSRATALIGAEGAFYGEDFARDELGDVTPYHAEPGVHAAAAMVAAARGDTDARNLAVDAFIAASSRPCAQLDLTLGRSGSLLAAAMLLSGKRDEPALRAFGAETMRAIWNELDARPPIADSPGACLGLAHGWAGYLYAALRWCAIAGDPLPARLTGRLGEWAAQNTPLGRGVFWRCYVGDEPYSPLAASWCNGSAGQLFLCTLAHRTFGGEEWLRLAEGCAWTTWDEPRGLSDFCCGSAGRAYALLNFYRLTGEAAWLGRARQLANDAAGVAGATAARENALWKGQLGVAALIADLASPESARMPFFE